MKEDTNISALFNTPAFNMAPRSLKLTDGMPAVNVAVFEDINLKRNYGLTKGNGNVRIVAKAMKILLERVYNWSHA